MLRAERDGPIAQAKTLVFQQETVTNWECIPSGRPFEIGSPWSDDFRLANAATRLLRRPSVSTRSGTRDGQHSEIPIATGHGSTLGPWRDCIGSS
jgi:hypothetical protein